MGRPPVTDEARTAIVLLRATPAERARWERAAKLEGLTLSAWLRDGANAATASKAAKR